MAQAVRRLPPSEALDGFALTASQHYNFGNQDNWFFSFRGGLFGVCSRLQGIRRHSQALHDWSYEQPDHPHHIATMLFCMDSAFECFTFMLNALGQAVHRSDFRSVATEQDLKRVSPLDILGGRRNTPLVGYDRFFPSFSNKWRNCNEIVQIFENHDVTKHRTIAHQDGRMRMDPPSGFFESRGITEKGIQLQLSPMAEVRLPVRPKLPIDEWARFTETDFTTLEHLETVTLQVIHESFELALQDALQNIHLNDSTLHA